MGRLEIRVCGARNIGDVQRVGLPDPYVKVKEGDKKSKTKIRYKTRVVENSMNPVWNELFKFQVADYDTTQILFELWNDNVLVDTLLGSYSLALNGLVRGVVQDLWVILRGTKVTSTELHLRVLAVDFGRDPGPNDKVVTSIEQDQLAMPTNQTTRPHRKESPLQSPYPQAPQGLPQQVTYGMSGQVQQPYRPPPQPVSYGQPQPPMYYPQGPPPPPQPGYYQQGPPMSQPMFAPNFQAMRPPPPQQHYAPPPQQFAGPQMAYGVPPPM